MYHNVCHNRLCEETDEGPIFIKKVWDCSHILNGEPLQEVNCFKYLGSQVAADGECERDVVHIMNEGYRAWGALKSVLRITATGLGIKAMGDMGYEKY